MILRFLADEDFDHDILRGVARRIPELDFVTAQTLGLRSAPDSVVLLRAHQDERIVLTHDVSTMTKHAYELLSSGQELAGVCVVPQDVTIGAAIDDLVDIVLYGRPTEWRNLVRFLPLRALTP